ncbi:hypothetical protein [Rufibacter radiotolerans]|uniref:hypothetical protein n=1 Tax=Rufibacter radiotolerans TaxID=1379910 RepID=UPI00069F0611|nr:hypothetical protein [Rufibacter radiotolerans]
MIQSPMLPHRKKNRLTGFNYSTNAFYFVTSCVQTMACSFGNILNEQINLNPYGKIAERQWLEMLHKFPYLRSHAFVVMPNHMHGLLEIKNDLPANEEIGVNRDILSREELRSDIDRGVDEDWECVCRAGVDQQCGDPGMRGPGMRADRSSPVPTWH